MASTIALKRRIGSVKNTRQITKAMELVSASKMRRAQERAQKSRAYRELAYSLLARLKNYSEVKQHELFEARKVSTKLYIVITSNSGLAGAYNSNVLRILAHEILADHESSIKTEVITIGTQGANFARRLQGVNLLAVYPAFGDQPTENDIKPILNTIIEEFKSKKVDKVEIIYTEFKSNLVQVAKALDILPANLEEEESSKSAPFTNFEPSVEVVLDSVVQRLLQVQLWQANLESLASEHSMRTIAMKNATDNANDIIDDLTLEFNTARQASITQELAEITGGAEALKE